MHQNGPIIQEMWNQEKDHLKAFELLAMKHRVPRSILSPFWSIGGFVLGAGSALLGPRAAMACTVAVEKVITQHYNDQIRELMADNQPVQTTSDSGTISETSETESVHGHGTSGQRGTHDDLIQTLSQFRDDEQHHHDTGLENEAELTPGYKFFTKGIQTICNVAVKIAERV